MLTICCNLAALTVACLYYSWRHFADKHLLRDRVLRERVAYMLWVMAGHIR